MRTATLVAVGVLLSIQLGFHRFPGSEGVRQRPQAERLDNPCSNLGDHTEGPISIDDLAIKQRIELVGGALVEQGKTTEMAALSKQLGLDHCHLQIEAPSAASVENESQLYSQARQSVVVVSSLYKCQSCDQWHADSATGFVISSSGAIVTNHHVADATDRRTIVVMTADGDVLPVKRILAASQADDLAILQVQADHLVPLPIAREVEPIGGKVGVISHPSQQYYCYTSGIVSRYKMMKLDNEVVQGMTITADYARGSSGAPVLNDRGAVVGIVMSTESVYYSVENGRQKNLQMVFKTCIPSTSLLDMISATE